MLAARSKYLRPVRQQFTRYASSVDGNDAASGKRPSRAWATWSKVSASGLTRRARIGLKFGSYWREYADLTNATDVYVSAYGDRTNQPLPTFDCSDIASSGGWAIVSAGPCYSRAWAHDYGTDYTKRKIRIWENGVAMTYRSSQALAEANPGSFYIPASMASPQTVMIHPTGSGDPASNGKVYEITKREYAVREAGGNNEVHWVCGMRNGHHDGSVFVTGQKSSHLLAYDGVVHNMWVDPGGTATKCAATGGEHAGRGGAGVLFVTYVGSPTGTEVTNYIDCMAYDVAAGGFYTHTGGSLMDTVNHLRGKAFSPGPFGAANLTTLRLTDCHLECDSATVVTITSVAFRQALIIDNCEGYNVKRHVATSGTVPTGSITDYRTYNAVTSSLFFGVNTAWTLTNSTFCLPTGAGTPKSLTQAAQTEAFRQSGCIVQGYQQQYSLATGETDIQSNGNVFWRFGSSVTYNVNATDYTTIGALQAAYPALETTSTLADPLLVDPANGNFGFSGASPADTGGRTAGSRRTLPYSKPVWATIAAGLVQRYLMIDGHVPPP